MQSEDRADSRLFRTLSRALLDQGFHVRFRAHGRSMFPAIADGDVVEVSPSTDNSAGDVVLLEKNDGLIAHRVVTSSRDFILTRGDSCFEDDPPQSSASVLGRVTRVFTPAGPRSPHTLRTRIRQLFARFR